MNNSFRSVWVELSYRRGMQTEAEQFECNIHMYTAVKRQIATKQLKNAAKKSIPNVFPRMYIDLSHH